MSLMADITERLRFDAARCETQFSKGVATNIEEAIAEIARLRAALEWITEHHDVQSMLTKAREALNQQAAAGSEK